MTSDGYETVFHFILDERRYEFEGNCREGVLSHMQVWKKNYHSHTCPIPPHDSHLLVITESGLIPFRLPTRFQDVSYGAILGNESWSIGRIRPASVANFNSIQHLGSSYCLKYEADLVECACPLPFNQLDIYTNSSEYITARNGFKKDSQEVTLVSIGWVSDILKLNLQRLLSHWPGPSILILANRGKSHVDTFIHNQILETVHKHVNLVIVVVDINCYSPVNSSRLYEQGNGDCYGTVCATGRSLLPDNVMFNIGLDLLLTDLVVVVPAGYNLLTRTKEARFGVYAKIRKILQFNPKSNEIFAFIVPAYYRTQINQNLSSETRDSIFYDIDLDVGVEAVGELKSFPMAEHLFASQQSQALNLSFEEAKLISGKSRIDEFRGDATGYDIVQLMKYKTIMPPIAFNVSNNHGSGSVRSEMTRNCLNQ